MERKPKKRAETVEDLEVYEAAFDLQQEIFQLSRKWPVDERFSLTDQIRRSSRSVGACLAEAWAKRRYKAHWTSKLTDADGELGESRHWLRTAKACGYITVATHDGLKEESKVIGRKIGNMIANADQWILKDPPIGEPAV